MLAGAATEPQASGSSVEAQRAAVGAASAGHCSAEQAVDLELFLGPFNAERRLRSALHRDDI